MLEHTARSDTDPDAIMAFTATFGQAALDRCAAVAERLISDPDLVARVTRRHAALAEHYAALGAAQTVATARAAGRRAMLLVLLLESEDRFFTA
jgi:hypothetical protein